MSEPWFDPNTFGAWFGAIVGGVGGSLCGLLGAMIGIFLPRGKGRRFFSVAATTLVVVGLAMLGVGVYALIDGQPYGIWYPLVLCGVIFGGLGGTLIVVVRSVGQVIERRKMEADDLRHA